LHLINVARDATRMGAAIPMRSFFAGSMPSERDYCVVNSTTAIAIDSPTAETVAVVERTPIALSAPAKAMMIGVAVNNPNCASLMAVRPDGFELCRI
jgi:hypothetical protein